MSTRSRTRQARSTLGPSLRGRLHEMATTRPLGAPQQSRHSPHLADWALIHSPRVFVLGRPGMGQRYAPPGHGKTALARTLHLEAWRRWQRRVVVLDVAAACELANLHLVAGGVIDPLAWSPRGSMSSTRPAGEW